MSFSRGRQGRATLLCEYMYIESRVCEIWYEMNRVGRAGREESRSLAEPAPQRPRD